ncbi:hypothetical protein V493_00449 [Pseudogymnoascus sp. VKM F-4281 (FW-2241)]|nr:hypothetical protein V493_00449 [Pseudogymnoascus sp. VKM F-4281 (FW-2241)]
MPGCEYEASHIHDNRSLIPISEGRAAHHSASKAIYSDRMRQRREEQHADVREGHAKVDPVYVAKTSVGRPSSMDLSYFETFHKLGSNDQIDEEYGSMFLTSSIETWCDHRKWIFEDIRGEVLSLLTDLAATIHLWSQSKASLLILRRFNDKEIFSAIIYYCRRFASEFLKANSVTEQEFNSNGPGVSICKDMPKPLNTEIENVGVTILIDVLMNAMSIAVEIIYLDRSGTHINSHLVQAEDDNGIPTNPAGPIVHLLYRPGHYDILYKYTNASRSLRQQRIIDSASAASNIQTSRAGVFNHALGQSPMSNFNSFNLPSTVNIPGLSIAARGDHGFPSTSTLSDYELILTPTYPFDSSVSTPNMQYVPPISAASPLDSGTPIVPAAALSNNSAPSRPQRTQNLQVKPLEVFSPSLGNQLWHSKYEYETEWNDSSAQTFQTSMFKNSHYNTAHYSNPDFQPEEWGPDDERKSRAPRRFDGSRVNVHGSL